jgi:ribonuclease BN (tRNA processing enzyme)
MVCVRACASSCALAAILLLAPRAFAAASPPVGGDGFITLGTMGGPVAAPGRSQPGNVLVRGSDIYLVDVGDGTVGQLSKVGHGLFNLRAIFISHLHFDHTGGLAAVLGLRYQTDGVGAVAIYGPPGTRQLVDGLLASMAPAAAAGYGLPGQNAVPVDPAATVRVVELTDGSRVDIGGFTVTAAQNTHYSFAAGSDQDRRFKSLSLRFDLPDRSIVYTGDTGPSPAVERLAKGADVLVAEMIDVDKTLANVRRARPDLSEDALKGIVTHLASHHLTPQQVGELAERAGAGRLVVTHLAPGRDTAADREAYLVEIHRHFKGSAVIANDLDKF